MYKGREEGLNVMDHAKAEEPKTWSLAVSALRIAATHLGDTFQPRRFRSLEPVQNDEIIYGTKELRNTP